MLGADQPLANGSHAIMVDDKAVAARPGYEAEEQSK